MPSDPRVEVEFRTVIRPPVLIALTGIKGSGKNTAADAIEVWGQNRQLKVVQRGFADSMKVSAMRALGYTGDASKLIAAANLLKAQSSWIDIGIRGTEIIRISGRDHLKWFGTEAHRDTFGSDFWLDQLLPYWDSESNRPRTYWYEKNFDNADICVITDLRFENEANRVREFGGVIWEIDRGLPEDVDGHLSEQHLPRDLINLTIHNSSSIGAFMANVNSEMTSEFHMRFVDNRVDERDA